eukprot:COSAG02_NODE_1534_length_12054_cov_22.784442_3_plen_109_part_00
MRPLLVNNKKFDFRCFLLIGRTSPTVSLYHPGMLRVAPRDYKAAGAAWSPYHRFYALECLLTFMLLVQVLSGRLRSRTLSTVRVNSVAIYNVAQLALLHRIIPSLICM